MRAPGDGPGLQSLLIAIFLVASGCARDSAPPEGAEGSRPEERQVEAVTVGDLTPFETRKAEDLLHGRLSCLGCHTLDGDGGRVGPDLSRVGDRLSAQGIRRMITDPQGTRPGAIMPRVPMPDRWLDLVVEYLAGRRSGEPRELDRDAVTPPSVPTQVGGEGAPNGEVLYRTYCAVCHGARGQGDGPNARFLPVAPTSHADAEYMTRRPDDSLFDAIWAGGRVMNRSHRMPPFGETLSGDQVWALVDYMRNLCACQGPEWSRDQRGAR